MKREIVWVVASSLMALSLVMASCAPAVVEEEKEVVKEEVEKEVEKEVVAPTVEKPKYGGVLKVGRTSDITSFDEIVGSPSDPATLQPTNEQLLAGDWTKGAAGGYGTYETDWAENYEIWPHRKGCLAENWEQPTKIEGDFATLIFHIRQGVHWALNPDSEASRLVGGRELTVDDVIFSLKQVITDPRAYIYRTDPEVRAAKITSPAPWTVKIEIPWDAFEVTVSRLGSRAFIVPPEVVAKYGTMIDWKVSVGTGPFILTNFVPSSSATLVRNPNYWDKDPIGPGKGNQLPYLDGVKLLIIPDPSTLYAALRTAKVDRVGGRRTGIALEDANMLVKQTPQLKSHPVPTMGATSVGIAMKLDSPPFNDIRVRRAMFMAIDFEGIKRDYYGGEAQILTWPITYVKEYADAYLGLDDPDCPASVKELYSYNPEKAKALLAEAGYPKGFKTNMLLGTTAATIDYASIMKDMWGKIGVAVELRPKESAALTTIKLNPASWDGIFYGSGSPTYNLYKMLPIHVPVANTNNPSAIDDPVVNETFDKVQSALVTDVAEANRLHRELMKYVLDQAWVIGSVLPPKYTLWWPWLKNYSGEDSVGTGHRHYYTWVWLDQELKKSMGY